jgi:fatty acid desaturase
LTVPSSVPLSAAAVESRGSRAIDEAIHAIPLEWFKVNPAIYWGDFLASASLGWMMFGWAVMAGGWSRAWLLSGAIVALYRAVLFIHEIAHRAQRDVSGFKLAWNAIVGVPLLVPSFLYEGVHSDHHRQSSYGTEADPEYVPFGRRPARLMGGWIVASLLAPLAMVIRFGVLAPLSWAVPPLRRLIVDRYSALVINHQYLRHTPMGIAGRVQEAAACAACWIAIGLWWSGRLQATTVFCWFIASGVVSGINALRTLAAHRYDRDHGELSMTEQLLDSCTIAGGGRLSDALIALGHAVMAPVGLRYHALHHWIPSLPYHNLGRAHRRLVAALRSDAPYHVTIERGFAPAWRDLWRRSRTLPR